MGDKTVDIYVTTEQLPAYMEGIEVLFASVEENYENVEHLARKARKRLANKAKEIEGCTAVYDLNVKFSEDDYTIRVLAYGLAARQAPDEPNNVGL